VAHGLAPTGSPDDFRRLGMTAALVETERGARTISAQSTNFAGNGDLHPDPSSTLPHVHCRPSAHERASPIRSSALRQGRQSGDLVDGGRIDPSAGQCAAAHSGRRKGLRKPGTPAAVRSLAWRRLSGPPSVWPSITGSVIRSAHIRSCPMPTFIACCCLYNCFQQQDGAGSHVARGTRAGER